MTTYLAKTITYSCLAGVLIPFTALADQQPAASARSSVKPVAEEQAKPAGKGFIDPTSGMEFVFVKGGCFKMGDEEGSKGKPAPEVCVSDFYLGKYEVTNAQYRLFMPKHSSGNDDGADLNGDKQPVVNVNYRDEALGFARWLGAKSGKAYRLPTEAEWEYAARGGTTGSNFWGDITSKACRYANTLDMTSKRALIAYGTDNHLCRDNYKASAPVGSFEPNAFGLYDMMGNVWEWTADWYDIGYIAKRPRDNPKGPAKGWARIIKGGGWNTGSHLIRASMSSYVDQGYRLTNLGFRLAAPARDEPK